MTLCVKRPTRDLPRHNANAMKSAATALLFLSAADAYVLVARRDASPKAIRSSRISCGWGPDPIWTPNKILSIDDAAEGLKAITIEPPDGVADGFLTPGQYVQIRAPGAEKAGFFAIASAPGASGPFEFLIKEQPPSDWSPGTGWLTGASAGAELEMSQVMGGGFKVADKLESIDTALLLAAGSGISPLRSVIESGVLKDVGTVELYYGAKNSDQMAYQDKFAEWEELGVKVNACYSPDYVQNVAKANAATSLAKPDKTVALLCGMKGMAEGVKEVCVGAGMDEGMVLTNF